MLVWSLPHWLFPPGTSHAGLWELDGLHSLRHSPPPDGHTMRVTRNTPRRIEITIRSVRCAPSGKVRATHEVVLTVLPGGTIHLANCAETVPVHSESLARVGLAFALPSSAVSTARWYGRGPHESYPDRQVGYPQRLNPPPPY